MANKKTITLGIGIFILAILLISFASAAYFWACFEKGEKINYCAEGSIPNSNYGKSDVTCNSLMGCQECMSNYYPDYDGGCYIHGSPLERCYALGPQICSDVGGDTEFDLTPPVLNILSPVNTTYSSKKILLKFSLDETADVYYKDLNKGTETWTRVCDNCAPGNPSYSMNRSFAEGENDLMFKAVDVVGNTAYANVKFIADSIAPRIYKTYPLSGFVNTEFEVQFKETNPETVTLHYGDKTKNLDLESECEDKNGKTYCETDVDLSSFHGQNIIYYFEVEDITGKIYKSRTISISVDTKDPVVNNPGSFYNVNGRYVTFNISITEDNFYKVTYVDSNTPSANRILCTRLTYENCVKKQSFTKGAHLLSIQITDKAGHSIALPANFDINY